MKRFFISSVFLLAACATATTPQAPDTMTSSTAVPWDLANLSHERVDYWIDRFSTGDKREEFALYLSRKPQYEAMIRRKLEARGMPQDLVYLAMIESGFNPEAHSAQAARGIWQLIPDTARRFGLRVDETIDERLDPEKSTDAALEYLSQLYERFGSWYLAAAAYNTGENRLARIMVDALGNDRGSDADYYRIWDQLPGETRDFVPVMIAAATIAKSPDRYGF